MQGANEDFAGANDEMRNAAIGKTGPSDRSLLTLGRLGDYVADSELIHADETPWRMLKMGSKKW